MYVTSAANRREAAAFLLLAAGQTAGVPIAGALAGAITLEATFLAFAGVAVATTLVRPHRADARRTPAR